MTQKKGTCVGMPAYVGLSDKEMLYEGLRVGRLMYEDNLPKMTDSDYKEWFDTSKLLDGVRIGRNVHKSIINF